MNIWTISALVFLAFELYMLFQLRNQVNFQLSIRRIYSNTGEESDLRIKKEALSLLRYIGIGIIVISKVYLLFSIALCFTKFFYIGLTLLGLTFLKGLTLKRMSNPASIAAVFIGDSVLSILCLLWVIWNR